MPDILTQHDYDVLKRIALSKNPSPEKFLAEKVLEEAGMKEAGRPLSEQLTKAQKAELPELSPDMKHGIRRMAQVWMQDRNDTSVDDAKQMFSDAIRATHADQAEPPEKTSVLGHIGNFFKGFGKGFVSNSYERELIKAISGDDLSDSELVKLANGLEKDVKNIMKVPDAVTNPMYSMSSTAPTIREELVKAMKKGMSEDEAKLFDIEAYMNPVTIMDKVKDLQKLKDSLKSKGMVVALKLIYEKKHQKTDVKGITESVGKICGKYFRKGLTYVPVVGAFFEEFKHPDAFVKREYDLALSEAKDKVKEAKQERVDDQNWRQLEKARERGSLKKKLRRENKISQIRALLTKKGNGVDLTPSEKLLDEALRSKGVNTTADLETRTWYGKKRINIVRDLSKRFFALDAQGGVAAADAPRMTYSVENVSQAYNKRAMFEVHAKGLQKEDKEKDPMTTAERVKAFRDAGREMVASGVAYGIKAFGTFVGGKIGGKIAKEAAELGSRLFRKGVDFIDSWASPSVRLEMGRLNREKHLAKEMQVRLLFEAVAAKQPLTPKQEDLRSFLKQNGIMSEADLKKTAALKFVRTNVPKKMFEQYEGEEGGKFVSRMVTAKESQIRAILEKAAARQPLTNAQKKLQGRLRKYGITKLDDLDKRVHVLFDRENRLTRALNLIEDAAYEKENGAFKRAEFTSDPQFESEKRAHRAPSSDEKTVLKEMQARYVLKKMEKNDVLTREETILRDALREKGITSMADFKKKKSQVSKIPTAKFEKNKFGEVKRLTDEQVLFASPVYRSDEEEAKMRQAKVVLEKQAAGTALTEQEKKLYDALKAEGIKKMSDLGGFHFMNRSFVKKLNDDHFRLDANGRIFFAMTAKETQLRGVLEKNAKGEDLTRDENVLLSLMNGQEIYNVSDLYRRENGVRKLDEVMSLHNLYFTRDENGRIVRFDTDTQAHDDIIRRAAYPVSEKAELTKMCYKRFRNVKKAQRLGAIMTDKNIVKRKEVNEYKPFAKLQQAMVVLKKIDLGVKPEDLPPIQRDLYAHLSSSEVGIRHYDDLRDQTKRDYVRLGIPSKFFEKQEDGRLKSIDVEVAKEIQIRCVLIKKNLPNAVMSEKESRLLEKLHELGIEKTADLKNFSSFFSTKYQLDVAKKLDDEYFLCDEYGLVIPEPINGRRPEDVMLYARSKEAPQNQALNQRQPVVQPQQPVNQGQQPPEPEQPVVPPKQDENDDDFVIEGLEEGKKVKVVPKKEDENDDDFFVIDGLDEPEKDKEEPKKEVKGPEIENDDDFFVIEGLDEPKKDKEEPKKEVKGPEIENDDDDFVIEGLDEPRKDNDDPHGKKVSPAIIQSGFKKGMDKIDIYEIEVEKPNERGKEKGKEQGKDQKKVVQQAIIRNKQKEK